MKKRVVFEKKDKMRFVAHLDTLRLIERLFRRAKLKLVYTQGYHPRPKLSFGFPVSMGIETFNEMFDIELLNDIEDNELKNILNSLVPEGFYIKEVRTVDNKSNIVKEYNGLKYEIDFEDENYFEKFKGLLEQEEILLTKKKKGKTRTTDLKGRILKTEYREKQMIIVLNEISPKTLISLIEEKGACRIKRIEYINI